MNNSTAKKECCNLNEVVGEFYTFLRSFILAKVKDPTIAEDIVQDVMMKLVKSHNQSIEIKNIKAWLFKVSRNAIFDHYQKKHPHHEIHYSEVIKDEILDELPDIVISDYIVPMIDLLAPSYSIPLKLSDIEKIPQKEIAQQLGLELSTTKMRIQRGRAKLRALFEKCWDLEFVHQGGLTNCSIKPDCERMQNISKKIKQKTQ